MLYYNLLYFTIHNLYGDNAKQMHSVLFQFIFSVNFFHTAQPVFKITQSSCWKFIKFHENFDILSSFFQVLWNFMCLRARLKIKQYALIVFHLL